MPEAREIRRHRLNRNAQPAARDGTLGLQFRNEVLHQVHRNGEADADIAARGPDDGGIDADDLALEIDQRAAYEAFRMPIWVVKRSRYYRVWGQVRPAKTGEASGAATTIDRASVGESRIGRGSKLDNLVQVGHSCTIGEDTLLCAQVGLAGSSHVGSRVILAGQAGVAGHLTIGDDVVLTAKSATSHDIPAGKVISGIPAFDNKDWLRSAAAFRRLGEIQRTVRELERKIKAADNTD